MKILFTPKPINKTVKHGRLFVVLVLTLIMLAGFLIQAKAQSKNLSDWNVPPPLPPPPGNPSSKTKADKSAANKIALRAADDVPAVSQPIGGPVQLLVLAAISNAPPNVNTPDQPVLIIAGMPDIPIPDAPDAPELPKQTQQDVLTIAATDLPLPESPEIPVAPAQPVPPGEFIHTNSSYPLTPEMPDLPSPTSPPFGDITAWSTPAIAESETFRLVKPTGGKAGSAGGKGVKKAKSPSRKK